MPHSSSQRIMYPELRSWSLAFQRAARRSTYTLSSGSHSNVYFDVATFLLGLRDSEEYTVDLAKERSGKYLDLIIERLSAICESAHVGKIAFIGPDSGQAIGMLPTVTTVINRLDRPTCIVRPYKRLKIERIIGAPIVPGEDILLISDVATTGRTLVDAAHCLQAAGGRVGHAFVIYDRQENARQRLEEAGITLHAIDDHDQYQAFLKAALSEQF